MINNSMQHDCGIIGSFISDAELDGICDTLARLDPTTPKAGGRCHGLDKKSKAYPWFKKVMLDRLKAAFDADLDLIFGMLLHSTKPFGVHSDHFELTVPGKQFKSFLIPLDVDGSTDRIDSAKTIIFNEIDEYAKMPVNPTALHLPPLARDAQSALDIWQQDLSHIPKDSAEVLSVKMSATWRKGDLIYWDSLLLHTSNDFIMNNCLYKECIVMHTYIPHA